MSVGFYGKVPSHGDFISRRLPPEFIEPWDAWLQQSLAASQAELGEQWLTHYLVAPIWRFMLGRGIVGPQNWAGVLMPSVDRVGRYFPLTLAAPTALPETWLDLNSISPWFDTLEDWALSSLCNEFAMSMFDEALGGISALATSARPLSVGLNCPIQMPLVQMQSSILSQVLFDGCSLWWTLGSSEFPGQVRIQQGLPIPTDFSGLLTNVIRSDSA
ncbi:type VI secretion system-associated protein TagF [Chitinivorax sp. B]|uniref:type VI secretion system-associated protein TagF n=1 Tax=Chitinivorax sp. B TaxID=2502235 RepID=UPI0010F89785|nr:type VI secretion system-associated protein TagF [Chitinivorax sp. B]